MLAAVIVVISGAMLAQFVVFFWRASMLATAAQPISDRLRLAQSAFADTPGQASFGTIATMTEICPSMGSPAIKLWPVRCYHAAMHALDSVSGSILPKASAWARQEMAACTQYAAVSMDRRLAANQDFLAEIRSY